MISSTKIRNALNNGDIELANEFLGYKFHFQGKISRGKGLGRKIGFPTANISLDHENKIIAGIAQGIANYFSIDAFIIRLFFIALIFINGFGFGLYLLIWISSKYAKTIKQKMDMSASVLHPPLFPA